jgi:hypothetical protein
VPAHSTDHRAQRVRWRLAQRDGADEAPLAKTRTQAAAAVVRVLNRATYAAELGVRS